MHAETRGGVRLAAHLAGAAGARGMRVGKQRVQRLMQVHGIRARASGAFALPRPTAGTICRSRRIVLDRNFIAAASDRPGRATSPTSQPTEGWLFLAVVIDLFSRRVVGWSLQPRHAAQPGDRRSGDGLVQTPARPAGELLFHSDRGSQYASEDFRELLDEHGITASMSRKGNCWDNACSETLFGSLKVERLHGQRFATIREAKDAVLEWLRWYNRTRMHSTLAYVSPMRFEQDWTMKRDDRR